MVQSNIIRSGINPAVEISGDYAQLFGAMSMLKKFIDMCADVVVISVSEDGRYVNCRQLAGERMENGDPLPCLEYNNIPIVQIGCSSGSVQFKISAGDVGVIFARKFDVNMPYSSEVVPERLDLKSGRIFSFSQGFFFPVRFIGSGQVDFLLQSGSSSVKIDKDNIEVQVNGQANIQASTATIQAQKTVLQSTQVFLGGEDGALPVARHGDVVKNGSVVVGTIEATSTVSKTL